MYVNLLQFYEAVGLYVIVGISSVYIKYKPWDEWMDERRGTMAGTSESWGMIYEVTAERMIKVSDGCDFA